MSTVKIIEAQIADSTAIVNKRKRPSNIIFYFMQREAAEIPDRELIAETRRKIIDKIATFTVGSYVKSTAVRTVLNDLDVDIQIGFHFEQDPIMTHQEKIESFAALERDWDTYGAPPITAAAIKTAVSCLKQIYQGSKTLPTFIAPTRQAGVSLQYRFPEGLVAYLIGKAGTITVSATQKSERKVLMPSTEFNTELLPLPAEILMKDE